MYILIYICEAVQFIVLESQEVVTQISIQIQKIKVRKRLNKRTLRRNEQTKKLRQRLVFSGMFVLSFIGALNINYIKPVAYDSPQSTAPGIEQVQQSEFINYNFRGGGTGDGKAPQMPPHGGKSDAFIPPTDQEKFSRRTPAEDQKNYQEPNQRDPRVAPQPIDPDQQDIRRPDNGKNPSNATKNPPFYDPRAPDGNLEPDAETLKEGLDGEENINEFMKRYVLGDEGSGNPSGNNGNPSGDSGYDPIDDPSYIKSNPFIVSCNFGDSSFNPIGYSLREIVNLQIAYDESSYTKIAIYKDGLVAAVRPTMSRPGMIIRKHQLENKFKHALQFKNYQNDIDFDINYYYSLSRPEKQAYVHDGRITRKAAQNFADNITRIVNDPETLVIPYKQKGEILFINTKTREIARGKVMSNGMTDFVTGHRARKEYLQSEAQKAGRIIPDSAFSNS